MYQFLKKSIQKKIEDNVIKQEKKEETPTKNYSPRIKKVTEQKDVSPIKVTKEKEHNIMTPIANQNKSLV